MNTNPLPSSALRARFLLAAWNTGDLERLESALEHHTPIVESHLPSAEIEKLEMIDEVVGAIRGYLLRARSETDVRAAIKVLRHVGRCDDVCVAPSRPFPAKSQAAGSGVRTT